MPPPPPLEAGWEPAAVRNPLFMEQLKTHQSVPAGSEWERAQFSWPGKLGHSLESWTILR